ncbi:MAG: Gfo/Idh/MocA family oxidoreductase [Bacteroidetes bacterium]|nr:Gfo/Idh/MocA family oxidoreductase [Bacteroidota bacterium]
MIYGFGIIGVGMIAEMHAKAINELESGKLVACFDKNENRAKDFAAQYGGTSYTNLDEFLAHNGLDIVTVCTPSGIHFEGAFAAASAGKHIIVEKPLEITIERCDELIQAAETNGVLLSGIFPSRFHSAVQEIKKALIAGRFGKIVLADAYVKWFRTQEYFDVSDWKGTWAMDGGGALMNQSIHAIDLLQWFMGPVSEVFSFTDTLAHERIEVEDTAAAVLRFENGAIGVIEGTTSAYPGFLKKIEISGSTGSIVLEEEDILVWKFVDEQPGDELIRKKYSRKTLTGGGASDPTAIGFHGHQYQFSNMIEAIEKGTPLLIDGFEARKAVEIIQGIYRSSSSGSPVSLPLSY